MQITKRNGNIVDFNKQKIVLAIEKSMIETEQGIDHKLALRIANDIEKEINEQKDLHGVEQVQDKIEEKLMSSSRKDVAKKYILFREYRNQNRIKNNNYKLLDDEFISKYKKMPSPMSPLGNFVYYRTYSRWIPEEKRREYWWETVRRAVEFNCSLTNTTKEEAYELFDNIFNLKQFLSGRTFWVANTDISKEYGTSNYNCSFTIINDFSKFKELFYLLMVGTGVGFRVLLDDVKKLPPVKTSVDIKHKDYFPIKRSEREDNTSIEFIEDTVLIRIGDSKEGWTQALDWYLRILYENDYRKISNIILDYDNVRPKGERLKRFGGTASGHESLKNMFEKITNIVHKLGEESRQTYCKLRPIHCLDICNIIGENVVVGGVRRTAEVGIIDINDRECIEAKTTLYVQENGKWITNKEIEHRKMSNNSIFYNEKPTREQLHWQIKQMRYSGEPAFINAVAGKNKRDDFEGANPCLEILLRDLGLCNLTTNNIMAFVKNNKLDLESLLKAQKLSVRAGLRMTCLPLELYKWNQVQSEDRLLGCSLTGWQDAMNVLHYTEEQENELLSKIKNVSWSSAKEYAGELNIPVPKLITTVKPEGTLSLLPVVSSGVHYSHSPYYIRRIRINANDPLCKVCEELDYPVFPEVGQTKENCTTKVIEFPVKAPEGKTKFDISAIEQLENYRRFMKYYVDHNCSITITVKDNEWEQVEEWLWDNWDEVVAVSFLSLSDSFYQLMPYEAITKEEYEKRVAEMKPFIPSLIGKYEKEEIEIDLGESECANGVCPIR
jgi:adenosylcobalamin-dependent ribonucleoside-triphosphate reductase